MDERPPHFEPWQYGLIIRPSGNGWDCRLMRHSAHQGAIVWEEWHMPSSDTRTDVRTVVGELWAAATELLERCCHLT